MHPSHLLQPDAHGKHHQAIGHSRSHATDTDPSDTIGLSIDSHTFILV